MGQSQIDVFKLWERATRATSEKDQTVLDLLFGSNPITDDELRIAIKRRPYTWSRYEGYLGTRVGDGAIYWGA